MLPNAVLYWSSMYMAVYQSDNEISGEEMQELLMLQFGLVAVARQSTTTAAGMPRRTLRRRREQWKQPWDGRQTPAATGVVRTRDRFRPIRRLWLNTENLTTAPGADYDRSTGIRGPLHRHNLGTAYGHNLIGNT
jgi:hypothetical protein